MGSIQWANDYLMVQKCVDLSLIDKKLPDNIKYNVIFGCRLYFMHPVSFFILKRNRIRKRFEKNPIYQYVATHENCSGTVNFVNRKSFFPIAKKSFKEDLIENDRDKNEFRGRLRGAIFFDNYEQTDEGSSFSRWIFLKDGTLILWQNKGNSLLNVKPEHIPPDGYNCKVIKPDFLK